jgi:hypothetical protein
MEIKMVSNFHKVMTLLQKEIDDSLATIDSKKTISSKRFILEQAASEMLSVIKAKKSSSVSKNNIPETFC